MLNRNKLNRLNPILTETLPFELPVIFSNEDRRSALSFSFSSEKSQRLFRSLVGAKNPSAKQYWVPFQFEIRKGANSTNLLSLIHPAAQIRVAEFYLAFSETIIERCAISPASLRYPHSATRVYTPNQLAPSSSGKTGVAQQAVSGDELENERITSFFSYRDFSLLGRFFESVEFKNLEMQFLHLRTLDVAKCFYNIYTHSITWAIKSKEFAKANANTHSFEQKFDRLLQRTNFNETNGIVVGPEFSRIFAECIFQRIDLNCIDRAKKQNGLIWGEDYTLRRYVDDYFIFANDRNDIATVEGHLTDCLKEYKLFINNEKTDDLLRPFITQISLIKRDIRRTIGELRTTVEAAKGEQTVENFKAIAYVVREKTDEARATIGEHGGGFNVISGWTLTMLQSMVQGLLRAYVEKKDDVQIREQIERSIASILKLIFYTASLDPRVATSYALGRILAIIEQKPFHVLAGHSDWILHLIEQEMISLTVSVHRLEPRGSRLQSRVELLNLIVIASHYIGQRFAKNDKIRSILNELADDEEFNYFSFICLKFVGLKDLVSNLKLVRKINKRAIDLVSRNRRSIHSDSETNHMLCDLLSSPDINADNKRKLWRFVSNEVPSNDELEELSQRCGFADWSGLRLSHTLRRKRLRAVYE